VVILVALRGVHLDPFRMTELSCATNSADAAK